MGINPYSTWYKLKNAIKTSLITPEEKEYKEGDKILMKNGRTGKIMYINNGEEKYKKYKKKYLIEFDDKTYQKGEYDQFDESEIVWKIG